MRSARVLAAGFAAVLVCASGAQAATPELSTNSRLQDRREVAAGQRSYVEGFQDGRFYANGWHSTGEMGGVWAPPLKLVDGVWFGVDDQWVGQATKFSSGWGYTRYDLPDTGGLHVQRTDVAPDANRAALFGLALTNPAAADKTVTVKVDAHSELMTAYPWGFTGVTPNASDNIADQGAFTGKALQFTDDGALPGAPEHHYAALVAANQDPASGEAAATGGDFRGPQPGHACAADDSTSLPSACDDGPFGKGTGGELRYQVTVPAGATKTLWVAVAGSDKGLAAAQSELAGALAGSRGRARGQGRLARQAVEVVAGLAARRPAAAERHRLGQAEPGRRDADRLGPADPLDQPGQAVPAAAGNGRPRALVRRRLPRLPVDLRHRRRVHELRGHGARPVRGRPRTTCARCATSPTSSTTARGSSCTRRSRTARSGSATTRRRPRPTAPRPTTSTATRRSSSRAPWRSSGAGPATTRFRDEMYDFAKRNLQVVDQRLDVDHDGWPEGSGNVERPGMGPEKLDNGVYYIRSLYDLADMARSKHDRATEKWATKLARKLQRQFEGTWWDTSAQQYADSLDNPGNVQNYQKHWIGQVPMEAELNQGDVATPGVASNQHGTTALAGRENSCFSGDRPGSLGLFHTGCGGGQDGKGDFEIFSLTTSIQAVAEGNFGRLGPGQQQRYTDANAETMFSEPATGNTPDEQPGAMPEIFPSAPNGDRHQGHPAQHRPLLDLPVDGHAGVGQLRDRVVGGPPAARRAPLPQRRRAAGRAAGARPASPAWRGRTSGSGAGRWASSRRTRRGLHDQGRRHAARRSASS